MSLDWRQQIDLDSPSQFDRNRVVWKGLDLIAVVILGWSIELFPAQTGKADLGCWYVTYVVPEGKAVCTDLDYISQIHRKPTQIVETI